MPRRCSIYVNNLPDSCRHEDLRRTFGRYGPIIDVTIPTDYYSGRMKGFAFVEFEDSRDAEYAQRSMDQTRFMGRRIEVEFTRGYRKTPAEMRDRANRFGRRRSRSASRQYSRRSRSYSKASDRDRWDHDRRSRSRSSSPRNGSSAGRMRSNGEYEDRSNCRMSPPAMYADDRYRRHQNARSGSQRSRSAT
ncbi:FUS interacting serine arginine rich protein 1 [Echinococcus multilocularis]|uniref:FUS interacting serine arginine rich protein 1 n=1 Tax=Echinococcus multilocularis TaxID=6211 RepID=A0A068Y5B9_ECHMU|nr:FUS interacting serine arginine rich protein 1 [Echinococcus multilocularis]